MAFYIYTVQWGIVQYEHNTQDTGIGWDNWTSLPSIWTNVLKYVFHKSQVPCGVITVSLLGMGRRDKKKHCGQVNYDEFSFIRITKITVDLKH